MSALGSVFLCSRPGVLLGGGGHGLELALGIGQRTGVARQLLLRQRQLVQPRQHRCASVARSTCVNFQSLLIII